MKTNKNALGQTIEDHENGIVLNLSFWDCECEKDYIHNISKNKCDKCDARKSEQPNSRVNEIEKI